MKRKLKLALGAGVALVLSAGTILTSVAPAFAAPPPWEPDTNAAAPYGRVVFYDAAGNVLTGGTNLSHLADFAAATTAKDTGATLATLYFAAPDHTKTTSLWTAGQASASTVFPDASAPAPITGPGFANPLVKLVAGDADLNAFLGGIVPDTTTGYANIYQVRLKDSGPGGAGSGTHYWETDIQVSGSTWSVLDPTIITTTTSITTTPANGGSAASGSNVGLSATVSPPANGFVQFFDGLTAVGTSHAVTTGNALATDTATAPADGSHTYSAVFTPTGGTTVRGSTSPTSTVTINPSVAPATANNVSSTTPQTLTVDNLNNNTITINYGTANDSKGNPETITGNSTVVTAPTHGTAASTTAGQFKYTNTDGTATTDSFVVAGATVTCSPACSNEPLTGNEITVNVTINAAAAPATANNVSSTTPQTLTVANLGSNTITISYGTANDSKSNPETITGNMTVVTPPAHGTAVGTSAGHYSYTNTDGTATTDSFVVAGATVTCSPACSNEPLTGNDITVNVTISPVAPPPSADGAIAIRVGNIRARGTRARVTAAITNVGTTDIRVCDTDVTWETSTGSFDDALRPSCVTLTPGSSKRYTYYFRYSASAGTVITLTANLTVADDSNTANNSATVAETVT